jgi:inner membrane protein
MLRRVASLGHVAVGMLAGRFYADRCEGGALGPSLVFIALSMAPDLDVIAFPLGIPYEAEFGHRGASHGLITGLLLGALFAGGWARLRIACRLPAAPTLAAVLGALAAASHGLLDTVTYGGLGVALAWPFALERFHAPFRLFPAVPIGIHFLSAEGLRCVLIELAYFFPAILWALRPARPR